MYVQDVSSWRAKETDEGLSGAVELFCGNRAAEWALSHVAMVMVMLMLGVGCGDPLLTLYTGLGLQVQGVSLANAAHMLGQKAL